MRPVSLRSTALRSCVLAALVVFAFSSALSNAWVWDDAAHVTSSSTLKDADGLRRIWLDRSATPQYYPLTHTTFWLEARLWGWETWPNGIVAPRPFGYHLDNVLLHAAGAVLLYLLLLRLGIGPAWVAAAVVALHPVTVESVAWVTERKNVLSLALALGAALAFLRYADSRRGRYLALFFVLFLLALLSKTVAATLPAVLLLVLWWRRTNLCKRLTIPLGIAFLGGAALGWQTAYWERVYVGAEGIYWDWSFVERALIAGRALWTYALHLATPWDLAFMYDRWDVDTGSATQFLAPILAMTLPVALLLGRARLGRGPLVAVLVYGGVLFPALGFLNVYPHRYSFVADHFQHHAAPALLVVMVAGCARATQWASTRLRAGWLGPSVAMVVLAALGVLSWGRCLSFKDEETLWEDTIRRTPTSSIAYNNLGHRLLRAEDSYGRSREPDPRRARELFERAVELDPQNERAANNLAAVLIRDKEYDLAERVVRRALALRPRYFRLHLELGRIHQARGETEAALQSFLEVAKLVLPGSIPPLPPLIGGLYFELGRYELALPWLSAAVDQGVEAKPLLYQYATALHHCGASAEALELYERFDGASGLDLRARTQMLWLLSSHENERLRDPQAAVELAESLLAHEGGELVSTLDAAACAFASAGRFDDALELGAMAVGEAMDSGSPIGPVSRRLALYAAGRPYLSPIGLQENPQRGSGDGSRPHVEPATTTGQDRQY